MTPLHPIAAFITFLACVLFVLSALIIGFAFIGWIALAAGDKIRPVHALESVLYLVFMAFCWQLIAWSRLL